MCSGFVSSSFVCERPRRLWTNSITVGIPARATSAASWSGPLGRRCERRRRPRSRRRTCRQLPVEQDRLDRSRSAPTRPRCSPPRRSGRAASCASASIAASLSASRCRWSSSCSAVSTTEVTIPGLQTTPPEVQTAPSPVRAAMSRISSASLAAPASASRRLVHRRRAGVRRLTGPGDPVPLDAERAEDGAQRQVEPFQHRPLLDVQLEIGGGVLELAARLGRAVEVDAVRCERLRQRDAVAVRQPAQLVLVVHRPGGRARAEQAAPEAGALLVGPVDEPHRGRAALPSAASRRSTSTPAITFRQPSSQPPFGTESMCPPISSARSEPPAQREPLVPGLVDLLVERQPRELSAQPLPRLLPGLRPRDALRAVLVSGQLLQFAELVDGAVGLERHARSLEDPTIDRKFVDHSSSGCRLASVRISQGVLGIKWLGLRSPLGSQVAAPGRRPPPDARETRRSTTLPEAARTAAHRRRRSATRTRPRARQGTPWPPRSSLRTGARRGRSRSCADMIAG